MVDTKEAVLAGGKKQSKQLHLIGYDEAKLGDIDIRTPTNDHRKRRYVYSLLLHSQAYEAYSKNQIVNLFFKFWECLFMKKETNVMVNNFLEKYY